MTSIYQSESYTSSVNQFRNCYAETFCCSPLQSSNVENLSPQIIRHIAKEVASLTKDPPEGIKVIPNEEDITDIQATIEGPGLL